MRQRSPRHVIPLPHGELDTAERKMSRTRNGVKWLDRADRADRLAQRAGKVPARQPGDGKLTAVEDAPGSYLKVRASE